MIPNLNYNGQQNILEFLDQVEHVILMHGWTSSQAFSQLLVMLSGPAFDCIKEALREWAAYNGMTERDLLASPLCPTFEDASRVLLDSFGGPDLEELKMKAMKNCKLSKFGSCTEYYYTKLRLINRVNARMSNERKVHLLLSGMPANLRVTLGLKQCVTPEKLLESLKCVERYSIPDNTQETATLEEINKQLKKLQLKQEQTEITREVNHLTDAQAAGRPAIKNPTYISAAKSIDPQKPKKKPNRRGRGRGSHDGPYGPPAINVYQGALPYYPPRGMQPGAGGYADYPPPRGRVSAGRGGGPRQPHHKQQLHYPRSQYSSYPNYEYANQGLYPAQYMRQAESPMTAPVLRAIDYPQQAQQGQHRPQRPARPPRQDPQEVICYACNEVGHMQRACPYRNQA